VLGLDMAGTAASVGDGVTGFHPGDEVFGMVGGVAGLQGTLAEFIVADAALLAHKPKTMTMRQSAAMPLVTITAWEGLVDRAKVHAGQTVLIHAGVGGVGYAAVQIALARGAKVFTTVSADKRSIVEALGSIAIDRNTAVNDYVAQHTGSAGFDIVYDTLGGAILLLSSRSNATRAMSSVASVGAHTLLHPYRFAQPPTQAYSRCCPCCRVWVVPIMDTFFTRQRNLQSRINSSRC
jgi:NADPH:quinone reductase-like Zn-dependent oxidoreductase